MGHVAYMREMRNACRILVGKPKGKRPLMSSMRRWEDNIIMNLKEIVWEDVDWIHLAQDSGRCRAAVNAVMNLLVSRLVEPL
jgi:hypothetical protein